MRLIMCGAGFSVGTAKSVPTDRFFRSAEVQELLGRPGFETLRERVDMLRPELGDGLEGVWTHLDYAAKFNPFLHQDLPAADESYALRQLIAAVYGRMRPELRAAWGASASTAKAVVNALEPGDVVASFNWDVLMESFITWERPDLELVQAGPSVTKAAPEAAVRIIKPHGSLSWIRQGTEIQSADGIRPRLHVMEPVKIGPAGEPLILGAMPIKSELIGEIQAAYGASSVHECIQGQWVALIDALSACDDVWILGYRLPPEDGYGRFLLREGVRARENGPIGEVRVWALESDPIDWIAQVLRPTSIRPQGRVRGPFPDL